MSTPEMNDFHRIKRLPPYVFGIVNDLKAAARARGEDIIDFGMGNPDQPTPQHIVDKLCEAAQRGDTHRYSLSKGIPRLRKAICDWYRRRYDVDLDPETQAIVTIGSKEGIAHLALACVGPGDTVLVPNPTYPIHPYGFIIAGADVRHELSYPDFRTADFRTTRRAPCDTGFSAGRPPPEGRCSTCVTTGNPARCGVPGAEFPT